MAIAGGITISAILLIFSIIPNLTDSLSTEVTTRSEIFEVSNALSKTNMNITTIVANSGTDVINFNFTNDGTEKLWNYKDFDLLITYDADISGVKTRVTEKLIYNATAAFQEKMTGSGSPQFSRPDNDDLNADNWVGDDASATNIFEHIDDNSDADWIESASAGSSQDYTTGLSSVTDPVTDTGHVVRFTYGKSASGARTFTLDITLREVSTTIRTFQLTGIDTTGFTQDSFTLTPTEADNIGNYADLNILITQTRTGGGAGRDLRIGWIEFEVPGIVTAVNLPGLQSKEWTVNLIKNDNLDPHIVNTQENAHIVAQLSYPIFSNGLLKISITSDNGREENDSTTVL